MRSTYSRVTARSHRSLSQNAKCIECKVTYIKWSFLDNECKCFKCNGYTEETLVQFIQDQKAKEA